MPHLPTNAVTQLDATLVAFRTAYGDEVSNTDIFYYVYDILHSPSYR